MPSKNGIRSLPPGYLAEIYGCFDGLADIHPDKSTEFLLQMTADTMKCSYSDASAALEYHSQCSGDDVGGSPK